ncbi:TetR/AcrR family transcriptional regulator [Nocardioides sp. BGMRC 2183]|nr:TetR/AcrR family transcriptional regulator [Nocardioides sp. BGMRC 2183]
MSEPRPDGRRLRWEQHKRERRRHIIDAAIVVLEEHPAGESIHVQQIADRAGIHRTVLYRHFEDRTDLDVAVQREICRRAGDDLFAVMNLEGTPSEITHRIVDTYVRWTVAHPSLMRFVERDFGVGPTTPLEEAIQEIAERIELLINSFVAVMGVELPEADRDALDPFVFGLVGGGFQAAKRWAARGGDRPALEDFVDLLARNIWRQIVGIAAERGIEFPDVPVDQLLDLLASPDNS